MSSSDELLLVQELPMDMHSDGGAGERRLAHVLPPLACDPGRPPFRPPPPPSAAAAAEFRVAFRGWLGAPRHWELWVAKLRPIHERLWRELGIFDAVLASTYRFKRDASAVLHLASFWSPGTNTFAFPWGEATLTLEDVAVLGGFPADGSAVPAPLPPQWGSDEAKLNGVRLGLNRSACKKAHHAAWIKYFLTDSAMDAVAEHGAFLALWLTRFVLPGHPESTMRQSLFPLAVRMARGDRVALGPAVLASLYRDLREMKTYLVAAGTTGGNAELLSPLSVYAPLYLLQLWIWERFPILCDGKANPIKDGEPWAARWHDVSKKINPAVIREVLGSGNNFMWKPYPSSQQACKHHSGWVRGSDISENGELLYLAHCVRACELVGADCIEQYLPHRVAMQFGLDQDVPGDVHRANEDWEVAMETYDLEGKKVAIFIPHSEPGVTARYAQWWRQPLPSCDLDVGAGSISVEGKVSKRKVKKTLAAMEAEEEKERKMKKARISPNNDKKRKLGALYDAKLSDWLATARKGSSGTGGEPGGSCKRGSTPKYDDGSDKPLLASVETGKDDIVLLVPGKQVSTLAVNLKKDKDMNLDRGDKLLTWSEYEGVNLKGYMADDQYHPVNEPYFKEEAVVSTEISKFNEDANGEWSNDILKNANELARREVPDVPNRPEELKLPMCMENEECYDRLTGVDCSEDDREEAVIVDKPRIFTSAPEGGNVVMLEDKMVSLHEDKCLDATDVPEEGATVVQELEKKANLAVDESCGMSNGPEEVTALDTEDREETGTVAVDNEGAVVSEGVGKAVEGTSHSSEVVPGSKQGIYAGIMYIPSETAALAEVILPVQQANDVGECVAVSCIMVDTSAAAGVQGTTDGETSLNFVAEEKREISCMEEIEGGENNQISEKNIKQKPEEAPRVDIVECGEDITLMEKNNGGENDNVTQTVEKVVTDNNMAAVVLGFPEGKSADVDKALNVAKKDAEDMHKEVLEVEDAKQVHISTLANGGANEGNNVVAEVEHIDMTEAKLHAQFDTENPEEAVEVGHADMDDYKRSTARDTDGEPGDVPEDSHTEVEKAKEQIESNNDDKVTEFPDIVHAEKEEVENLMKEDADEKFEEVFDLENRRTGGTHGPMEEDTDGNLNEVSDVVHAQTKDTNDFMKEDADNKFQEISEWESIGMGGTHGLMEEDTDGKLNEVPEVNAEVDETNETEKDNDRPDSILHVHLPSKGEARCFVEEDIKEDNEIVPQVKHANIKDEAPVENDSKEKPNADGKGLAEKEVEEFKEIYQAKQAEGEEHKVLMEKDTEESTNDAPGVKHAEEQQDETLSAKYMRDYIEQITVVEPVDGQSETLAKIGAEENPEEISRAQGKELDNGTMESLKNSVNSEVSSTSIQSKEEQKEVFVEDVTKKQCFQDVDLINEMESLSDGTAMEIQVADDHKTLNMHDEVAIEQRHDRGMICENKETQILKDNHIVHSGLNDLVVMEVDEAWSTVRTHNQEAFDLEKEKIEARQDLGSTIKNNKMVVPGDAIMPGCSEFQTDSPETKISEAVSTKGIMSQEHLFINEEQVLEKGLECKLTEENARPLVVTNVIDDNGVDSTVVTVYVNKANCIQGILNQEVCSTEEAREGKQHTGVGDVRILEETSTNGSGDAGTEKDLCIEKDLAVLEKQDEGTADENTERKLVDTDAPECGEAKHDGTMEMIDKTGSAVQAVNMAEDKIPFKNKQNLAVLEKQDEGTRDKNTEITLVDTDAPECGKAKHDGTMEMIHKTDSTVQAVNLAENKISFKNKQNMAVLEKQDEGTTDENTKRTLVDTDAPECDEVKHVGAMKMIHETDSTVQAVNMAEDKIPFKNKQKLAVLEKQDEGTTDKNTERTLVDADAPECGKAKHDGAMQMIRETNYTVQAVNLAEDKISFKNKQNLAVLEKQDEGTTDGNTERTLVDTDAPDCDEVKHVGAMKMIHDTGSTVQAVNLAEDKIPFKNKQNPTVLEKQNEGTTEGNTERTLVGTDAPGCGEAKHDGTMKTIHGTDSTVQAVNIVKKKIIFKIKQKGVPFRDHNKSVAEGSGSNQTARKEFKGALQPDFEHKVALKQAILEDRTEMSIGRENDEASEQEDTSPEDDTIAHSGMDRGENNNEWAEEPVKSYGKYASNLASIDCQTTKFGRPSIEEVKRIHSGRSVYLKDMKESQGRIHSEPSDRTPINSAGYYSRHGVQEPVTVSKDIKVPSHDAVSACGRDLALELVTAPPEETPRWRQEQYALNILEDVQNARIAEKTRMEMEIRILKAQIVSMQKQVMNMDHAGEVVSRSKRH